MRQDRDRLKQEKAEAEKLIESLKDELQERTDERNRIAPLSAAVNYGAPRGSCNNALLRKGLRSCLTARDF